MYQPEEEGDTTEQSYESDNITPVVGDSFLHGAPISSTPLVRDTRANHEEDSWSASIESPFDRLHREVQNLAIEDKGVGKDHSLLSDPSFISPSQTYANASLLPVRPNSDLLKMPLESPPPLSVPRSRSKGKTPLRENILRQNARLASSQAISLQKTRRHKTPQHPYSNIQWNGLVDLRQSSPSKPRADSAKATGYDSDSSDDLIPPGMSPPVTMQFAMPARLRTSPVKLSLTPAKKAAERIGRDYIASAASRGTGLTSRLHPNTLEPSTSSIAPSLPSITKYTYPSSSNISNSTASSSRAIIPNVPSSSRQSDGLMTPAHQIFKSRAGPQLQATRVTEPVGDHTDEPLINLSEDNTVKLPPPNRIQIVPKSRLLIDDEASPGSDSDLSEHDEQNPSNGFLYATQNNVQADDSFSDDGDDSVIDVSRPGDQLHPVIDMFAQFGGQHIVDDSFDQDSFSASEDETVFGGRQAGQGDKRLNIRNDPLIDETHTGAVLLNPFAQVEQSPTPYLGQATPLDQN